MPQNAKKMSFHITLDINEENQYQVVFKETMHFNDRLQLELVDTVVATIDMCTGISNRTSVVSKMVDCHGNRIPD